ncbi:MAG TPA: YetF domain-containing protein [Candidatus Acidoferrum sp.]|nr:YetF domain-containing protein [Candidatus Acidoferrum sp.]
MTVQRDRRATFNRGEWRVTLPAFGQQIDSSGETNLPREGQWRMHDIWKDMFVLAVPVLEKILRPIAVYAFLIIGLRLSGKRELVQLNPFDLVVLLTLSNTVQNAIIGDDNTVTGGVIGASSLLIVNYLVVRFLYNHRKLDQLVEGRADVLIEDGKVRVGNLKRELITMAQLEAAARKQGFESIHEVQQCVLEPGGTITFIGKKPGTDESRHRELLDRMEKMTAELAKLREARPPAGA